MAAIPAFLPYLIEDAATPGIEAQPFTPGHIAQSFGAHGHNFHEIVVFERPGGIHRVAGADRSTLAGSIDIIGEGVVHHTSDLGPATGWMVLIRDDELARLPMPPPWDSGEAPRYFSPNSLGRILGAARDIHSENIARKKNFALAMRAHLAIIVFELIRLDNLTVERGRGSLIRRLTSIIDERIAEPIVLQTLATGLALSPGYLTTEVRRQSGRTAMEWVAARRLRAAQQRLVSTDDSIATVALQCGFTDGAHLARRFRECYGLSPTEWRRLHRKSSSHPQTS